MPIIFLFKRETANLERNILMVSRFISFLRKEALKLRNMTSYSGTHSLYSTYISNKRYFDEKICECFLNYLTSQYIRTVVFVRFA
jgi:hypothetical protein